MANEFKVKNGLIVDAGGAQITGGITGSTDFNTLVNKPTLISSSAQITTLGYAITGSNSLQGDQQITGSLSVSGNITGSVIRANSGFSGNLGGWISLASNGGEIRIETSNIRFKNNIPILWSQTTDSNGTKDLGLRRNDTGSLEIYDGVTVDGAVINRRDLILRNITGSNAFFSGSSTFTGSLGVSGSVTATSFVGNGSGITGITASMRPDDFDFNVDPFAGTIGYITNPGSNYTVQATSSSVNIIGGVTSFVVITSQSFSTNATFTASLATGYTWVGGAGNISTLVSTSSFGGGSSTNTSLNSFTASQYVSNSFFATTGSNLFRGNQTFSGSLIPDTTNGFDLGSATRIWKDLYISTGSIKFVAGTTVVKELTLATLTSLESATGSINSLTASIVPRLTNLETTSASVNNSVSQINTFTASNANISLNSLTASISPRLTNLETTSASVNISVSNLNTLTSSLATTYEGRASATKTLFSGSSQITYSGISSIPAGIISGSSQLSGTTITDLTIVNLTTINQTASVVFSSGSNRFGDAGNDIHSFTGSVNISGSQNITGSVNVNSNLTVNGTSTVVPTIVLNPNGANNNNQYVDFRASNASKFQFGYTQAAPAGNRFFIYNDVLAQDSIKIIESTNNILIGYPNTTTDTGFRVDVSGSTRLNNNVQITGSVLVSGSQTINGTLGVLIGGVTELNVQQSGVTLGSIITDVHRVTGSLNITGSFSASLANGFTYVGGADNITRLVATSSFGGSVTLPSGLVSGSSQITLSGTTGYGTVINQNLLTTSDVTHNTITGTIRATNGVVSGSGQVAIASTSGFGTYLNQAVLTTSNPTHASLTISGGTAAAELVLTSTSPTITFKDTDNRTGYWHFNSDTMYLLSGANGSGTSGWAQISGQWPFTFTTSTNAALCGGALSAVGDVTAYSSDKRLKENIVTIKNPLEKVLKLRGVYYDWKDGLEEIGFVPQQKHDIGVIAQELEEVIPEAVKPAPFDTEKGVSKSGENYKTVQMEKIIPILIEGMKEQQKQIEELKNKIEILINNLEK